MTGIKKIIGLDLLSIKPYMTLKNHLIFLAMAIFYGLMAWDSAMSFVVVLFSVLFASYPFLVGEDSGIDGLYRIFGVDHKQVVKGRYLTASLISLFSLVFALVIFLVMGSIQGVEDLLEKVLVQGAIAFIAALTIIFLQYPLYFKHGYKKAKTIIMTPILVIGLLVLLASTFSDNIKGILPAIEIDFNPKVLLGLGIIAWIMLVFISVKLSEKNYGSRDF